MLPDEKLVALYAEGNIITFIIMDPGLDGLLLPQNNNQGSGIIDFHPLHLLMSVLYAFIHIRPAIGYASVSLTIHFPPPFLFALGIQKSSRHA